ncbi:MAG TPA: glycosylase [Flavisolibacter sp.]|nr:glycosylase [Flavisolibacter sp.]
MQRRVVIVHVLLFFFSTICFSQAGKSTVPDQQMQAIYQEIKTPFKYGLVVVPKNDLQKVDCPTVFRKGKMWYMSYIVFDGRGYETWLAKSSDLLNWQTLGRILTHSNDTTQWDASQKAGYLSLVNTEWGGDYALQQFNKNYWISYIGGKESGYETGLLSIGMAYTGKDATKAHAWQRLDRPVLTSHDVDVRWWENKKEFKSTVIRDRAKMTGYPFVMYYNANGDTARDNKKTRWFERIGMAVSNDMVNWKRFQPEPVVHHPVGITGDPYLQKIGDVWVMFYFGAFWQDRKGAFNRFACSYDLINWTDWTGENLIESSEPFDSLYAHKSCVVKYKGVVYHFYNAVNKKEQRGIAVATSKDLGKSRVGFVATK